ncbi:uncharacterized protein [Littorina saxatilis]|uniref:Tox-ART-HYD1 domain-containing protein n=1 Tax=Littorina saxatilis TaxID=31220 RepID=A0AAN9BV45_9CAEN
MADGKKGDKETMYHYTSPENAKKIHDTGIIKPSSDGVFGGDKVYLTSKSPTAGRKAIAQNNYDGAWQNREQQKNVDAVVKVDVDKSKLTKETDPDGRDIYTHKGPLKLGGGQ